MAAPEIIAICGPAGAGKSTIADHLVSAHGYTRIKFAGPLKDMLRALGLDEDEVEGHLKEKPCALLCGKTPRHAMITLGTEWGRNMIDKDLWANAWRERVAAVLASGGRVVVDDLRFPNERDLCGEVGAVVLRVTSARITPSIAHESERYALTMPVDREIANDGGVPELLASVDLTVLGPYSEAA